MWTLRIGAIAWLAIGQIAAAQTPGVDFNRDIRPILSENCLQCHGPDAEQRESELRLDVEVNAKADRDGQRVIAAGDPAASQLLQRVTSNDADLKMPPADTGKRLSKQQIELLRRWIRQGAKFEKHWSLLPPRRPSLPKNVKPHQAIDYFVRRRLRTQKLPAAEAAERTTWIRRVSLDLIGLPPTPGEVSAFVNDSSHRAFEKVVDRLLGSARYGEHMARYWMDAARYADTNGYQYDLEREQWVWRDWVIHAFNSNMPFDRFTIEQLAGDLLPDATDQQRLATAFHRNHPITIEGGVIDEEYRTEYVVDRVVTTSSVWMGMTLLCSRCHDHKYDPISQKEFYKFFAFFNHVPERGNNGFNPKLKVSSPLAADQSSRLAEQIAKAKAKFERLRKNSGLSVADLERRLRAESPGTWDEGVGRTAKSSGGAVFKRLKDGSFLATGKNPQTDTYVIDLEAKPGQPLAGLQLEALPHATLTNGSTGRGTNGNFVLSELTIMQIVAEGQGAPATEQALKLSAAEADYSQANFGISLAIDGKRGKTGWAVDGHQKKDARRATFWLKKPLDVAGPLKLRVRMEFRYGLSHQIGRFRLSLARGTMRPPLVISKSLAKPVEQRSPAEQSRIAKYLFDRYSTPAMKAASSDLLQRQKAKRDLEKSLPATMVMSELAKPRDTHVLFRGQYDQKREKVTAGTPAALPPMPAGLPTNRLGLAKWLVMKDHPLTARVTVNRFWQHLFGRGIVETAEDFGSQGDWPSHPELLDWLAVEFVESGWNVKQLLKTMVLSKTYRQSSRLTPKQLQRDPDNRWLARGPRFRLDAEVIRDSALFAGGQLVERVGGPSVFPYHPKGLWQEINNRPGYSRTYRQDRGDNLYRRSLYTFWKRTVPPPAMATFDAPEREVCVVRRSRTNTPLQAFVMLHDPQFVETARRLARRMVRSGGKTTAERLKFGFQVCLARSPGKAELQLLTLALNERRAQYVRDRAAAKRLLAVGELPRDESIQESEHAAYTAVARIILNLAEFITKN